MSFRRSRNRHDEWRTFVAQHDVAIANTGLSDGLFVSENAFVGFLTTGHAPDHSCDLAELPDEQFKKLEIVVNEYFFDGWHQQCLTAFSRHRLERFSRYA